MSEVTDQIIQEFRKLHATEKVRLVQQMWDEISDEVALLPLTAAQRRTLDDRIDDHEANPGDVEPWEHARDEVIRAV